MGTQLNLCFFASAVLPSGRKQNMRNYSVIGLFAVLVQAYAADVQDMGETTVGMPSLLEEQEWIESAPARLAMAKKVKAMKAAAAMKAAPKAMKAMKAMKASKKAELLQGVVPFTQLALYGFVAFFAFTFGLRFRCKSLGVE